MRRTASPPNLLRKHGFRSEKGRSSTNVRAGTVRSYNLRVDRIDARPVFRICRDAQPADKTAQVFGTLNGFCELLLGGLDHACCVLLKGGVQPIFLQTEPTNGYALRSLAGLPCLHVHGLREHVVEDVPLFDSVAAYGASLTPDEVYSRYGVRVCDLNLDRRYCSRFHHCRCSYSARVPPRGGVQCFVSLDGSIVVTLQSLVDTTRVGIFPITPI
jgi:hypothetical protein